MTLQADEETPITEISFLPDGRVCVFGMSREVLQVLGELSLGDPALARRYERMCQPEVDRAPPASVGNELCAVPGGANDRQSAVSGTAQSPFPTVPVGSKS